MTTPIIYALQKIKNDEAAFSVVKLLVESGAKINLDGPFWNSYPSPLYYALKHQGLRIVEYLISCGADVNAKRNYDGNYLEIAYERCNVVYEGGYYNKFIEFAKCLIESGIDINTTINCDSLLMIACQEEDFDLVKYLVERGIDVNLEEGDGYTALAFLPKLSGEIFEYLLDHGGDINGARSECYTALQTAVEDGDIERVNYLLNRGADINHEGYVYETPLMLAVNNLEMFKHLYENGADPYYRCLNDDSLLNTERKASKDVEEFMKNIGIKYESDIESSEHQPYRNKYL